MNVGQGLPSLDTSQMDCDTTGVGIARHWSCRSIWRRDAVGYRSVAMAMTQHVGVTEGQLRAHSSRRWRQNVDRFITHKASPSLKRRSMLADCAGPSIRPM